MRIISTEGSKLLNEAPSLLSVSRHWHAISSLQMGRSFASGSLRKRAELSRNNLGPCFQSVPKINRAGSLLVSLPARTKERVQKEAAMFSLQPACSSGIGIRSMFGHLLDLAKSEPCLATVHFIFWLFVEVNMQFVVPS